jgi:hypothetical protein
MPFAALHGIVDDLGPYDSLFTLPFGAEIDRRRIGRRRSRCVPAFDVVARVGVKGKHTLTAPMRAEACVRTVAPQAAEQSVLGGFNGGSRSGRALPTSKSGFGLETSTPSTTTSLCSPTEDICSKAVRRQPRDERVTDLSPNTW